MKNHETKYETELEKDKTKSCENSCAEDCKEEVDSGWVDGFDEDFDDRDVEGWDDVSEAEAWAAYYAESDLMPPVFSLPTFVTYYCDNGFRTSDLEEAKAHGYGKDGSRAASWGHGDAFETFDYSVLPLIEKFSMKVDKNGMFYSVDFFTDGYRFMRDEVWYTSRDIENGKVKPLVGTAKKPYNFIDQGVDIYIFERDGYVMVLSAENWESYSDKFTGFRVKAEEFYQAWEETEFPEPYK